MATTGSAQIFFKDVSAEAGIHHQFIVYEGMFGGGACVFDFDKDGWEDIFITSGMGEDVLYRNNGNGTFSNAYIGSGLEPTRGYVTQGVASADINKDGWTDLIVTTITRKDTTRQIPRAENLVFINNQNSTFRNATTEYGIGTLLSFSTGVSFGDLNADGFPDAYIGNYFLDYEGQLSSINDATIVNANQTAKGYLLMNENGKTFSNEYEDYGLSHRGFGFGGTFTDFDNDRDLDILVNHDFGYKAVPNVFLVNEYPSERFINLAKESGMDLKINAMGTAVGDINEDGLLDYYVTNIRFNKMMVSQGIGKPFIDQSKELGMGYVSISWGANFADFDHDMDLDLYVANGDLNPNDVPMADYYFENKNAVFTEKARAVGINDYGVGRGSVVFDMDNDGDLDVLVVNQKPVLSYPVNSETHLYRNDSTNGHWLKVELRGSASESRGIGSRVEVVIGKKRLLREIDGGSSHLSQNSTIAHFGLGTNTSVDSVIVRWIGGNQQILTNQKANQKLVITEVTNTKKTSLYPILAAIFLMAGLIAVWIWRKKAVPKK